LPAIDISGMEGPVQLIPYIDRVLPLHQIQIGNQQQEALKK
jgi:hypothetical protein